MPPTETTELSRREREIALAYAEGASHREIGARLFIAPSTVRTHLGTIYRKLGVSSKIALHRALNGQVPASHPPPEASAYAPTHRASVAILPFRHVGGRNAMAEGLVQDIITRLSKLRGVRVMARGSIFALFERGIGELEAGRLLDVDYVTIGSVQRNEDQAAIALELIERRTGQVLWADDFACRGADLFVALDEIGDRIVACVASEIETAERNRAILKPPESLGAWESFHRGLWHMYRFTEADNQQAQALLFGMLGSRAMALFRLGAYDEAATVAASAAERPNAHIHIRAIAALCLAAAGRLEEASDQTARILASVPDYSVDHFMTAFRFPPETQALYRAFARLIGLA